ncbi:NB-ARC domain-containing disease resistance protein, partial [Prunus dulcis]
GKKCTAYSVVKLNAYLSGATRLEPDPIDHCFTDGNLDWSSVAGHPEFISQLMTLLDIRVSFAVYWVSCLHILERKERLLSCNIAKGAVMLPFPLYQYIR